MPILSLEKIHRSYQQNQEILKGVSLSMEAGDVVGLIGRNGAGKTSLLRIAIGILIQHQGSVRLFDMDPWEHPVLIKRRLGYVAESQVVPAHLSVRGLIDLHRQLYPTWDVALERQLLKRLELDDGARINTLSKGQARKAILLCAIAHRPELLILDEPAGGLDPSARREFLEVSIELLSQGGSTILFSSHHMTDVERIAGRVAILEDGNMLLDLELDHFRENFCLAVLPSLNYELSERLSAMDGFIRSRARAESIHVIFSRQPEDVKSQLQTDLGLLDARCTHTSLEEMFVTMVGTDS